MISVIEYKFLNKIILNEENSTVVNLILFIRSSPILIPAFKNTQFLVRRNLLMLDERFL